MDYNSKPLDLKGKMEALVHDLSIALEESSNSALARRRWGIRRRARSTGNIRKHSLTKTIFTQMLSYLISSTNTNIFSPSGRTQAVRREI